MLKRNYIIVYWLFGIILLISMIATIVWIERIFITRLRRIYINRHLNNTNNVIAFLFQRYNIVDIDTGTETCTELDENEYKVQFDNNILYANGIIDIETVSLMSVNYDDNNDDDDEETKVFHERISKYSNNL